MTRIPLGDGDDKYSLDRPDRDLTLDGERYIRMPTKALYWAVAVLFAISWGYFDLRAKSVEAAAVSKSNQDALSLVIVDINMMKQGQAIQKQKIDDFIDSSERLYSRYFRDNNDPEKRK